MAWQRCAGGDSYRASHQVKDAMAHAELRASASNLDAFGDMRRGIKRQRMPPRIKLSRWALAPSRYHQANDSVAAILANIMLRAVCAAAA